MSFVKLDTSILTSTLWLDRDAREVFITALLMAEPRELTAATPAIAVRSLDLTGFVVPPGWYGFAQAAGVGIVHAAGVEREAGLAALERLAAPEPDSRNPKWDGRRMVRIDGGYVILNYIDYRDRDHSAAARQRRWRERQRQQQLELDGSAPPPTDASAEGNRNGVTLRNDDVTLRKQKQKQKQKQSPTATVANATGAAAAPNPSQTGWQADAAEALRRADVPDAEIGDAIKNFWAHARRRFTDAEIAAAVLAKGRQLRKPWNPARLWNPRNDTFDERFRSYIARARSWEARTASKGLASISDILAGKGAQPGTTQP